MYLQTDGQGGEGVHHSRGGQGCHRDQRERREGERERIRERGRHTFRCNDDLNVLCLSRMIQDDLYRLLRLFHYNPALL